VIQASWSAVNFDFDALAANPMPARRPAHRQSARRDPMPRPTGRCRRVRVRRPAHPEIGRDSDRKAVPVPTPSSPPRVRGEGSQRARSERLPTPARKPTTYRSERS